MFLGNMRVSLFIHPSTHPLHSSLLSRNSMLSSVLGAGDTDQRLLRKFPAWCGETDR